MRRALFGFLLTGLFVLLLSALVVAPETEPPAGISRTPHDFHAVMIPAVLPAAQADLSVPEGTDDLQQHMLPAGQLSADGTGHPASSDSNGRILRTLRYENSFYQLFRPEVAGG